MLRYFFCIRWITKNFSDRPGVYNENNWNYDSNGKVSLCKMRYFPISVYPSKRFSFISVTTVEASDFKFDTQLGLSTLTVTKKLS